MLMPNISLYSNAVRSFWMFSVAEITLRLILKIDNGKNSYRCGDESREEVAVHDWQ